MKTRIAILTLILTMLFVYPFRKQLYDEVEFSLLIFQCKNRFDYNQDSLVNVDRLENIGKSYDYYLDVFGEPSLCDVFFVSDHLVYSKHFLIDMKLGELLQNYLNNDKQRITGSAVIWETPIFVHDNLIVYFIPVNGTLKSFCGFNYDGDHCNLFFPCG